jgi:hypothetical protein
VNLIRSRSLLLLLGLGLAVLALRPFPVVDRALSLALVPCRFLAELSVPVEWLQDRGAQAAESRVPVDFAAELGQHAALERMVQASALPATFSIPAGASAVHGEVVGRDPRDLDRVRLRVEGCRGLVVGLPVVSGDWFVGVVEAVDEPVEGTGCNLWLRLITGQDERIAARVESTAEAEVAGQASCRLVVGGLAPRADMAYLDIHNPSRRDVRSGRVVVDERPELGSRYTGLANGAWLGDLVSEQVAGKDVLGIRPGLDYGSGLYQVLILFPEGRARTIDHQSPLVLEDDAWCDVRRFLRAEPSAWREGVWVSGGRRDGIIVGSAVAAGARLCGRVGQVGVMRSSVHELGDPGLAIAVVAAVGSGDGAYPFVMGRIESEGRLADGRVAFRWDATVPIAGVSTDPPVAAELWTGSGEPGVPRGLWVGSVDLPRGPGPHTLHVKPPPAMARAGAWRVRVVPTNGGPAVAGGA